MQGMRHKVCGITQRQESYLAFHNTPKLALSSEDGKIFRPGEHIQ